MTESDYKNCSVGDIITIPLYGMSTVRAGYYQGGKWRLDLSVPGFDEEITGLTYADIFEYVPTIDVLFSYFPTPYQGYTGSEATQ